MNETNEMMFFRVESVNFYKPYSVHPGHQSTNTSTNSCNQMSKASSNTTLLAGIACVVAAGAAYYVMTQATPATSTKKSKKKKKKKEKKETKASAATSTTTTSSDTTTAPVPTASSPSAKTDATKATQNLSDVIDTQHNGVLHSELVDSSNSSVSATDVAMGVTTRDANGLQTGGVVGQDVILQFFEKSNTLLGEQNVKDDLAAAYSRGENISEILKQKQESVWASLKVEAQFGFTKIQKTLSDPNTMTVEIRDALVKAASMEDGILTYALLGSQEKFDAEQAKLKRLSEVAQTELQNELQQSMADGQASVQAYSTDIMTKFQLATAGFEALDEIGRLKKRQDLSEQEYKNIVKGQCLQQIMMQQQQRQGF